MNVEIGTEAAQCTIPFLSFLGIFVSNFRYSTAGKYVEIGTEAVQFLYREYINGIFVAVNIVNMGVMPAFYGGGGGEGSG
jgi:hypothetical protein